MTFGSSRSPYGERGLKSLTIIVRIGREKSLSLRRAWIEIFGHTISVAQARRRSPYGERGLKLKLRRILSDPPGRRSPYGERGLK